MSRKSTYRGRRARGGALQIVAVAVLAILLVAGAVVLLTMDPSDYPAQPTATPSPSPSTSPSPSPSPSPSAARSASPSPSGAPSPSNEPGSYTETKFATWHDYDYSLDESEAVDLSYFSDAAFIGDSLTDGLLIYSSLNTTSAANLSHQGLNVLTALTEEHFTRDGRSVTAVEALGMGDYSKVYLMLGVNELGWYNDQRFYNCYADLVDAVKEQVPDAEIYIQTLLPVTAEKSSSHDYFTNEKIVVYNDLIAKLAQEKGVHLLDTHVSVMDQETGVLPAEASSDGIHLKRGYYEKWLDYLKVHTVPAD